MKSLSIPGAAGLALVLVLAGCSASTQLHTSSGLVFQEEIGRAPDYELLRQTVGYTLNLQGYRFETIGSDRMQTHWQEWESTDPGLSGKTTVLRERYVVRLLHRGDNLYVARIRHECQQLTAGDVWQDVAVPASLEENYRAIKEMVHGLLMPHMHQASY